MYSLGINHQYSTLRGLYITPLALTLQLVRCGKSTHISMISNSVTHLQSYTNFAISDIAGNSARSPSHRRAPTSPHRASISLHRMTAQSPTLLPQTQTSPHRAPTSPHRSPISSHRMTECFMMFHTVLKVFHDV